MEFILFLCVKFNLIWVITNIYREIYFTNFVTYKRVLKNQIQIKLFLHLKINQQQFYINVFFFYSTFRAILSVILFESRRKRNLKDFEYVKRIYIFNLKQKNGLIKFLKTQLKV